MGYTLAPVFNKKFPGDRQFSEYTDGKDLMLGRGRFDEICVAKGVTPFTTLAGPDDEEMAALAAEPQEGETLPETWFSCTDGIRTLRTLIDALRTEKEWSKGFRPAEVRSFISCLEKLEHCLQLGKQRRAKFYLLVC